jgi:rare lipoprotein A
MKSLMQRITDRQTIVCLVFLFFSISTLAEDKDSVKTEVYATYYADRFHGRRTSNGEKYDKDAYTCAHRKLPFGTLVKVTNPKNGKTALVRVNDRGPYGKQAKIDLSKAAARDIGLLPIGILKVEMEVLADSIAYEYKQLNDTIQ